MNEQLKIIITAQIDKLKQNVEKAQKEVKTFKEQVQKASKDVDKHFQNMGASIASFAKAAVTGLAAAGAALLALGASTQEYRNEQAKLTTAFEAAGSSAAQATETYNDLYRVLGDSGQAVEAAGHLAKLTTEEQALAEWTNICQGVYATFGDSLPIESLTEAANETAKTGELTGALADALNWAGVSEDAFAESLAACTTEAEREQLIRDTLNGLYSEAAATYEQNNAQVLAQNEAQGKLQATMAALGEAVAPVITAFTNFANEALAAVTPYIQQLAENYMPVLQEALSTVSETLGTVMGYLVDNWEIVLAVAGVITGIATAIGIYNAVAAVKAAMAAVEATSVWGLVAAYTAQAAAMVVALAPYLLIVAAIAAVIAIIVLCVKHWDEIKETVTKVWQSIKQKTEEAVNKVVAKFNEMKQKAAEKIQAIKDAVVGKFNEIKTNITNAINNAKTALTTGFSNMVSGAKNYLSSLVSGVREKFESIVGSIRDKMNSAKSTIKSIIDAIVGFFTGASFKWPSIPMPHFSISPSGWKISDLLEGSIPKLGISWYAKGGVFDKPTLFMGNGGLSGLGENGAEAVVPLEKNTEWMNKLAAMLSERMGSGQNIVLQVDGKTFAQISCDSINELTRQRGSIPLRLM